MENPKQPMASGVDTFLRGFASSAGSGAMMMGIFYALAFAVKTVGTAVGMTGLNFLHLTTISAVIPPAMLMIAAVGVFGGVMALKRMSDQAHSAHRASHEVSHERSPELSQSVAVPLPLPMVAADRAEDAAPTRSWVERTGAEQGARSHIQEILANRDLSDKGRAAAILADRENAAVNQR